MLTEGLGIELSDFEPEDAKLKGDYLWQVVEIAIGGVPTILEVRYMCLLMSLGRMLLQGSLSTNPFSPMRHQVELQTVEVGINLLGNISSATTLVSVRNTREFRAALTALTEPRTL